MTNQREFDVLLLDIEGTTSSISFVKDVLFPYARDNVEKFLKANSTSDKVKNVVEGLVKSSNELAAQDSDVKKVEGVDDVDKIVGNVKHWIEKDLKLTPLKELQGLIWSDGYSSGDLKAHVYDDTPRLFERAKEVQVPISIYSSGSALAQKLLFQNTVKGDLSPFLVRYFDTTVGAKVEAQSYKKIASELSTPPEKILFITDVDKEAFAAKEAGFKVLILIRRGNSSLSDEAKETFHLIKTFDEVEL